MRRRRRCCSPVDVIVEHLSRGMTIEAGDIIATGTPEGVALPARRPEYLADGGDLVETTVEAESERSKPCDRPLGARAPARRWWTRPMTRARPDAAGSAFHSTSRTVIVRATASMVAT